MSEFIQLRGMTWNHARGRAPLEATAGLYHQQHPRVTVQWECRSLKDFEDFPVERLASDFDLIVLDHPCIGRVSAAGAVLPLDEHLPEDYLADQAKHTVGRSHESYRMAGHQWALAIDAAAPVAFWREDLLERHGVCLPTDWAGLVSLAREGFVEMPSVAINCLMNFFSFALAEGGDPFGSAGRLVEREAGRAALVRLRELLRLCHSGCWERNPIASHELLASAANDRLCYCPFSYGYSNYARRGFSDCRLTFGPPPGLDGTAISTVLGGAGLAVSALRPNRKAAVAYAAFVASEPIQRTLYTRTGGQPGHRSAWLDPENNRIAGNYFSATLGTLDRAWVRPRTDGYIPFQDTSAGIVQSALLGRMSDREALDQLDALYSATFLEDSLPL